MIRAIALSLLLSGCGIYQSVVGPPVLTDVYSRAEVDAINAEIACRNQARTMLQVQRCDVRR